MKARRLAALATLTDARSRLERDRLERTRESHRTLERQRLELGEHMRRYEREPLEDGRETPVPLLLQRLRFVARLAERVVALGEESRQSEERVREASSTCRVAAARDVALGTLHRRVEAEESRLAAQTESRLADDAVRARGRVSRRGSSSSSPFTSPLSGERS